MAGNLPSRADGGRLYGCGTSDMKSGVAVQLRLAAHLPAPSRDVTYVFYECEEVAAERNGLLRLSRRPPGPAGRRLRGADGAERGRIEGGCQGTLRAEVTAAGKRAHTARSWMGRNAIHEAGDILAVLRGVHAARAGGRRAALPRGPERRGHPRRRRRERRPRRVRGHGQLPVRARTGTGEQAADFVRSLFAAWPVTVLDVAEGARPGLDHPAAAAFVAAVGAAGPPRAKLGWTDVARFAALGIPAVNYGPGLPELAHTAGEYVETAGDRRLRSPAARLAGDR